MKLHGNFTIREVAGEILVVPVGQTALQLNGMIILNPVSKVIWECLEEDSSEEAILKAVTDLFEVELQEAREDISAFLDELRRLELLAE